jgi:D-lactate dehydrogenase (cytochrome)
MRVRTDPDALAEFATDESGIFQAEEIEAVYYPQSEEELADAIARANAEGSLATLSGGGTGITGGRVAIHGGLVISTQDLREPRAQDLPRYEVEQYGKKHAIYVDEAAMEAYVPAGISLEMLATLLPRDLLYPPDPTEKTAFMGGTIATNASGARTFYYGPTRDWVVGLRLVLPNGEMMSIRRGEVTAQEGVLTFQSEAGTEYAVKVPTYRMPEVKNAAGLYAAPDMDLVDLFIGSEGLLGVVTEVQVRLVRKPESIVGEIAFFAEEEEALGFVDDLRQAAREGTMQVLAIEYFDGHCLQFMEHEAVEKTAGAAVYTEIAGTLDDIDPLMEALEAHESQQDWFAETEDDRQEQKAFRHSLPEGINSYLRRQGTQKLGTDLVVPAEHFREMIEHYHAAGKAFAEEYPREGQHYLMFGHIGNYHLHVNFVPHNADELRCAKGLYAGLARRAVSVGGTISGEHGVGKKTILMDSEELPYLEIMYGKEGLLEIARIKHVLDPNLILNVGNMVPREYLLEV